ncbi:MAG: hypothetical protein AB7E52_05600, partial [Bdellovibrionales bacterium]
VCADTAIREVMPKGTTTSPTWDATTNGVIGRWIGPNGADYNARITTNPTNGNTIVTASYEHFISLNGHSMTDAADECTLNSKVGPGPRKASSLSCTEGNSEKTLLLASYVTQMADNYEACLTKSNGWKPNHYPTLAH